MNVKHTPEPWPEIPGDLGDFAAGRKFYSIMNGDAPLAGMVMADYLRARACVNYCAEATNEELNGGLLVGLRDAFAMVVAERDRLRAEQNDARNNIARLAAALKNLLPRVDELQDAGPAGEGWKSDGLVADIKAAETALAKAGAA